MFINKHFNDITYHNYSNTQMKVYAKNSFDRFGDDLTELIVSYLWFEDKVRLECVSKQWRRLVFNKQFAIGFDLRYEHHLKRPVRIYDTTEEIFKRQELLSLLKKCPNITNVSISATKLNKNELSLFGQYCPRLKSLLKSPFGGKYKHDSLRFYITNDIDLSFFRMYGHKLEELNISGCFKKRKQSLKLCPNLKNLWFSKHSILFTDTLSKDFLPKLESFWGKLLYQNRRVEDMALTLSVSSRT